ncbi:MAG: hypothetical protein ABEJ74_01060 [Haloferacaceae archaeon]
MVEDRLSDGRRIAQLLASELDGLGGDLERVAVVDADPDVEPTADGALAYAVAVDSRGEDGGGDDGGDGGDPSEDDIGGSSEGDDGREPDRIAEVYVQPDRARIEFVAAPDAAADAATEQGLRVRPKASRPPRTLVFVEDGAQVKRAVPVVKAVVGALERDDDR